MGIMYKIRKVKGEPIFDNWNKLMNHDIIELEEIQEEKKETLRSMIQKEVYDPLNLAQLLVVERVAKEHYQSHPEELGLVRIEDVLRVFDKADQETSDGFCKIFHSPHDCIVHIRKAIEGMKG